MIVHEAVGQWSWHVEDGGAVFLTVASGPDKPAIGDRVVANRAIEDELLCDTLDGGGSHVQLIEKKNPLPSLRKELGW